MRSRKPNIKWDDRINQMEIALPEVLVLLLVLSISTLALVTRFSGVGAKEIMSSKVDNKYYGTAYAGIERARYHLLRPDPADPEDPHTWTEGHTESFTIDINGKVVTVTIKDDDQSPVVDSANTLTTPTTLTERRIRDKKFGKELFVEFKNATNGNTLTTTFEEAILWMETWK